MVNEVLKRLRVLKPDPARRATGFVESELATLRTKPTGAQGLSSCTIAFDIFRNCIDAGPIPFGLAHSVATQTV